MSPKAAASAEPVLLTGLSRSYSSTVIAIWPALVEAHVVEDEDALGVELRLALGPHDERAVESHLELHRLVAVRVVPERAGVR